MKPETLARISTVSNEVKRPVYSSHSVMLFCSGCDTVTAGAGAELEVGLLSQPASTLAVSIREPNSTMRFMGSFLQHVATRLGPLTRRNQASSKHTYTSLSHATRLLTSEAARKPCSAAPPRRGRPMKPYS